jgi:hypothetical protein
VGGVVGSGAPKSWPSSVIVVHIRYGRVGDKMWSLFTEPPVVGALIGLLAVSLIAPIVKKYYFDVRSRLRVDVRAWRNKTSGALKKTVWDTLDAKRQYGDDPMRTLTKAGGYMMVTITNTSKKKILGVSVIAPDTNLDMVWQIDDADEIIEVKKGQPIGVGDIQPKHSRVIHIWSNVDMSDFNFFAVKHFLRISADEIDSVRMRFPMPRYLWKKYEPRLLNACYLLIVAALFICLYLGLIR